MLAPAQSSPEYIIPDTGTTVRLTGVVELALEVDAAGNLKDMQGRNRGAAVVSVSARRPCPISTAQNLFRRSATANLSTAKLRFRFITSHQGSDWSPADLHGS